MRSPFGATILDNLPDFPDRHGDPPRRKLLPELEAEHRAHSAQILGRRIRMLVSQPPWRDEHGIAFRLLAGETAVIVDVPRGFDERGEMLIGGAVAQVKIDAGGLLAWLGCMDQWEYV